MNPEENLDIVDAYQYRSSCKHIEVNTQKRKEAADAWLSRALKQQENCKFEYDSASQASNACIVSLEEIRKRITRIKARRDVASSNTRLWDEIYVHARFFAEKNPGKETDVPKFERFRDKHNSSLQHFEYHLTLALDELKAKQDENQASNRRVAMVHAALKAANEDVELKQRQASEAERYLRNARKQLKLANLVANNLTVKVEADTSSERLSVQGRAGPSEKHPANGKRRKLDSVKYESKYTRACEKVGLVFLSQEMKSKMHNMNPDPANRTMWFEQDLSAFMRENDRKMSRRRTDNHFDILVAVLKHGGIVKVIESRMLFAIVMQLGGVVHNSTVLREIYTHDLYHYEQMLVHQRSVPDDEWAKVKMMNTRKM